MAFANPLVISVNSVNKTLNEIFVQGSTRGYRLREATQQFDVSISHTVEKARVGSGVVHRHNVNLTQTIFSTTPGVPDNVRHVYLVLRNGQNDDVTAVGHLGAALSSLLVAARYEDLVAWDG